LVGALEELCKKEKLSVDNDALYAIAKAAQGSFRDALSILDQVSAFSDRAVGVQDVCSMLGLVEVDAIFELCEALSKKDCAAALKKFDEILEQGKDAKQLAKDMVEHFRNLMVIKIGGKTLGRLVDYPVAIKEQYLTQSGNFTLVEILAAIDALINAQEMARVTESLRIPLEIAFAKVCMSGEKSASGSQPAAFSPQVRIAATPAPEPARPAAVNMLKNQRGQVNASTAAENAAKPALPSVEEPSAAVVEETGIPAEAIEPAPIAVDPNKKLTIEAIRLVWDNLTHAVSRKKMSLATYLQEGFPVAFDGEKLTIGFAPHFEFYKSTLENADYLVIVEKIFGEQLCRKIILEYKLAADAPTAEQKNDEPMVQKALETFKGSIVSQWHNE